MKPWISLHCTSIHYISLLLHYWLIAYFRQDATKHLYYSYSYQRKKFAHAPFYPTIKAQTQVTIHSTNVLREVSIMNQLNEQSVSNVSYTRDYEYSIQVNRWFLKPIGAWPNLTRNSRTEKLLVKLLNFICHSLIIFTVIPCAMYIFYEDENLKTRMKAIGPISHWMMGELNYCCLLMRAKEIVYCIEHVKHDWKTVRRANDRELMLKNAKLGRFIACIAALCMHSGIMSYTLITGFKKITFQIGNGSYSMYRLPCPFYTNLLDVRFSPMNEIVFVLQLVSGFIVTSVTVGACGLAAVLAMHACGQFNVVMARSDNLVKDNNQEKQDEHTLHKKLGFIVEHHLRTLR